MSALLAQLAKTYYRLNLISPTLNVKVRSQLRAIIVIWLCVDPIGSKSRDVSLHGDPRVSVAFRYYRNLTIIL